MLHAIKLLQYTYVREYLITEANFCPSLCNAFTSIAPRTTAAAFNCSCFYVSSVLKLFEMLRML